MTSRHTVPVAAVTIGLASLWALTGCMASAGPVTQDATCTPVHDDVQTITPGTLSVSVFLSPPYTTTQDGDVLRGIDGEIVKRIAEMECLKVEATEVAAPAAFSNIDTQRSDITIAGIYSTPERAERYNVTTPLYGDRTAIISETSVDDLVDLDGQRIGTIQGTIANQWLVEAIGSEDVVVYQDYAAMIDDLKLGRISGAISTEAAGTYQLEVNDVTGFEVTPVSADSEIEGPGDLNHIIIPMIKTNTSLLQAFDDDIETLRDEGFIAKVLTTYGQDPSLADD